MALLVMAPRARWLLMRPLAASHIFKLSHYHPDTEVPRAGEVVVAAGCQVSYAIIATGLTKAR